MTKPFKKSLKHIPREDAHGWAGARKLLLSETDDISHNLEAFTLGFLEPGWVFDWHMHEGIDEFFIVTQWVWTIEFEDETRFAYQAWDVIYNPAWLKHRIENTWDEENQFYFVRFVA